jgi:hypothetical protein
MELLLELITVLHQQCTPLFTHPFTMLLLEEQLTTMLPELIIIIMPQHQLTHMLLVMLQSM